MKKLTKIRLVNWHYISNETIEIKNNVLLTGANASGKSTILDALTYVLTAGETTFNLAANEKGKRDLRGYIKCKLGIEDKEYLRDGDVSGDIALEFYDEKIQQYFIIGVVLDAFGELAPVKFLFYSAENTRIEDNMFFDLSGKVYSTVEFRKVNRDLSYYSTKREAKRAFRTLYGSINEDFFKMITKALAFKPISDVKEFIYQNILEEKEIDVTNIRDAIRSFKDLESTLKVIQLKIDRLTELSALVDNAKDIIDKKNYLNYLMKLFDVKKIEGNKQNISDQIEIEIAKLEAIKEELQHQNDLTSELQEKSQNLYDALSNDEGFKNSEYLSRQIEKCQRDIDTLGDAENIYLQHASKIKETINSLRQESDIREYNEFYNIPLNNTDVRMLQDIKLKVVNYQQVFKRIIDGNLEEIGSLNSQKSDVIDEMKTVKEARQNLDSNRLHYPAGLNELRTEISENLKRLYNKDVSVHIFCELIEIKDKNWAKTIESFLGNQKFILIVEPRYYDSALQIFARIKNKYSHGFGIVNTEAIQKYNQYMPNSLASIMSSENKDAQNYINFTCGNVIMCESEGELKNYQIAITNDGLLYRGYVVRSMNLNVQRFIGSGAVDEQKAQWDEKASELSSQYYEIVNQIEAYRNENQKIQSLSLDKFINEIDSLNNYYSLSDRISKLTLEKSKSKKLSTTETQDEYNKVKQQIADCDAKKIAISQQIGSQTTRIDSLRQSIVDLDKQLEDISNVLANLANDNLSLDNDCRKEYDSMIEEMSIESAYKSCEARLRSTEQTYENLCSGILNKESEYIQEFNSNLSVGVDQIQNYLDELDKLQKSELVKYEAKVRQARETAEIIFKEDFISKLRNNISTAEAEISKINETLSKIPFGNDTYEFIFPKSKEYGGFYDMFKSNDVVDGQSIFTTSFEKTYTQQLDELFTAIASDSLDDNTTFNKFTDYRTYMDYDIKISNQYGESMLYSKVFREKSGGETQVPFYVAMIASFVRIYTQNVNGSSIGIIMLDEVFDKMDTNRMRSMMEFMTEMPLQFILACPPQRMNILGSYTDTTIVVFRRGNKTQALPMTTKDEIEDAKAQSELVNEEM